MKKCTANHEIFIKTSVEINFENSFVTIENQTGIYQMTKIDNKVYTFIKKSTKDTLHFILKNGKHKKIKIV